MLAAVSAALAQLQNDSGPPPLQPAELRKVTGPGACFLSDGTDGQLCIPAGEHIVMIGDSTMRYSYMHLAYALLNGHQQGSREPGEHDVGDERTWSRPGGFYRSAFAPGGRELPVRIHDMEAFFNGTMETLHDACDCYRRGCCENVTENRYFWHKGGVQLTTMQLLGRRNASGNWLPGQNFSHRTVQSEFKPIFSYNAFDLLEKVVPQLEPTVVVFNMGLHLDTDTLSESEWAALRRVTDKLQTETRARFIWRTTHVSSVVHAMPNTPDGLKRPGLSMDRVETEADAAISNGFEILPVHRLTSTLEAEDWWDSNPRQPHLRPRANNLIVSALIKHLYGAFAWVRKDA